MMCRVSLSLDADDGDVVPCEIKAAGNNKRRRKEKGKKKRESRVDDVQGFRSQGAHQTLNEKERE